MLRSLKKKVAKSEMNKTLYLVDLGHSIHVKDKTLYIAESYYPIQDVQAICLYGSYTINEQFIQLLSHHNILLHYFNYYGQYLGTYYPLQRQHLNSILLN